VLTLNKDIHIYMDVFENGNCTTESMQGLVKDPLFLLEFPLTIKSTNNKYLLIYYNMHNTCIINYLLNIKIPVHSILLDLTYFHFIIYISIYFYIIKKCIEIL